MNRFHVISNTYRDPNQEKANSIAQYLIARGKLCGISSLERAAVPEEYEAKLLSEMTGDVECALVLGGDGTIIQVAGVLAKKNIPLIGINLGNLGYLAEIELDKVYLALDKLINNEYSLQRRMMLEGLPIINGEEGKSSLALNDIVLTRFGSMRAIEYDIFVNDKLLTTIVGDGIVIATPTGSTGYSMSAGGPIVEPETHVILLTPISAHKLNSRPIVLKPDDIVTVKVKSESFDGNKFVQASFDGGLVYELDKDDAVTIRCASQVTSVIRISAETFIDVLSRKLSI